MRKTVFALMLVACAARLSAQSGPDAPPAPKTLTLSGPRFGMTLLSDGMVQRLATENITVAAAISQFGWQFEKQFYTKTAGVTALNEWVVLVGGLEQGVAIPSLNWLVGVRTKEGVELGVGPNVTPAGAALVVSAGMTVRAGVLNIPMNVAVVPTQAGTRVTVLTGFTMRR